MNTHCYAALQSHAERLGVEVEQVVQRALSAWLTDVCEDAVDCVTDASAVG